MEKTMEIIAHRGVKHADLYLDPHGEPDERAAWRGNTIPALMAAVPLPVGFGVRSTKDGHAVVSHDNTVSCTIFEKVFEVKLSETTLSDLQEGGFIGSDDRAPLLLDVLDALYGRTHMYMELEGEGSASAALHTIGLFRAKDPDIVQRITVSSFLISEVFEFRRTFENARIAWLWGPECDVSIQDVVNYVSRNRLDEFHLDQSLVTPEFVHWLNEQGCKVRIYTVNDPKDAIYLARLHREELPCPPNDKEGITSAPPASKARIAGIFTDFPDLMSEVLEGVKV